VKVSGLDSWEIRVSEWDWELEVALWVRAAERIDVPVGGIVTAGLELDVVPEASGVASAALAEGWLHLWNAILFRPQLTQQNVRAEMARFLSPEFDVLADFPDFRRVYAARYPEANAWHTARKRGGREARRDPASAEAPRGIEAEVVRAVEAEIGRTPAPFRLHVVVLPVAEDVVRPTGDGTYLVPERVRRSDGYEAWLAGVVRALA
jgi:hypothetical protein